MWTWVRKDSHESFRVWRGKDGKWFLKGYPFKAGSEDEAKRKALTKMIARAEESIAAMRAAL